MFSLCLHFRYAQGIVARASLAMLLLHGHQILLFRARILFSFNRVFLPNFAKIWRDVESKQSLITLTSVFAIFVCCEATYQPAYRTCLCPFRSARVYQASNPFVLDRSVLLPSVYMGSCKFLI